MQSYARRYKYSLRESVNILHLKYTLTCGKYSILYFKSTHILFIVATDAIVSTKQNKTLFYACATKSGSYKYTQCLYTKCNTILMLAFAIFLHKSDVSIYLYIYIYPYIYLTRLVTSRASLPQLPRSKQQSLEFGR